MSISLVDSHCHLQLPDFDAARTEILDEMIHQEIGGILVGTTIGSSRAAIDLAATSDRLWATVGYHPEHFSSAFQYPGEEDSREFDPLALEALARSERVVAIGETGLDFYRIDEGVDPQVAKSKQEEGFRAQVEIAQRLALPVVVHCREAFSRLIELIRVWKIEGLDPTYIIHCFTGSWADAEPLLELGCYISFSGVVTFPPRKSANGLNPLEEVVRRIPLERMLVETDAPFLAPVPHRGMQNRPTYVREVVRHIANVREMSFEDLARQTMENAKRVFGL